MKKKFIFFSLGLLLTTLNLTAQITWDFTTASPSSGVPIGLTVGALTQNNTNANSTMIGSSSPSSGYSGASGGNNANAATIGSAFNASTSTYFAFTATIDVGKQTSFTQIKFASRSTGTGPISYAVRTSADNYASNISVGTLTANSTWVLQSPMAFSIPITISNGNSVIFRIYGYDGTNTGTSANWRIDDLVLSYTSVLGAEITKFAVGVEESKNKISWQTVTEQNAQHFNIQRSTNGQSNWQILGSVKATGNSQTTQDYQFVDNTPLSINYYRLQSVDFDGKETYSKVVATTQNTKGKINVSPTSATDKINMSIESDVTQTYNLINTFGQTIQIGQFIGQKELIINDLPIGIYFIQIGNETFKFFKG